MLKCLSISFLSVIIFSSCTSNKDSEKELLELDYAKPLIKEIKNLEMSKLPPFDSLHYYYDNSDAKVKRCPKDSLIRPITKLSFPLVCSKTQTIPSDSIFFEFLDSLDFEKLPIVHNIEVEKTTPLPFDSLKEIILDKPKIIKALKPKYKEVNTQTILHFSTDENLPDNDVQNLVEDDKGRLWIETDKGISIYDNENLFFFDKRSNLIKGDYFNLKSSSPEKIFVATGNIKENKSHINIITNNKIKQLNLSVDTFNCSYNIFGYEIVKKDKRDLFYTVECEEIKPDGNEGIWFTLIFTLNRNGNLKEWAIPFYYDYKNIYKYKPTGIRKIIQDRNKRKWKSTSHGVYVNYKNTVRAITSQNKLSSNKINDIFCAKNNTIWFNNENNIYKIENNIVFKLKVNTSVIEKLSTDHSIYDLKFNEDAFGNILIYALGKPVCILDHHQITVIDINQTYNSNSSKLRLYDNKVFTIPKNNGFFIFPKDFFQNYKLKILKDSLNLSTNLIESDDNLIYSHKETNLTYPDKFSSTDGQTIRTFNLLKLTNNLKLSEYFIKNIRNARRNNIINGYSANIILLNGTDSIQVVPYNDNRFVFDGNILLIDKNKTIFMPGGDWINGGIDVIRNDTVFNIPHEFFFKACPIGYVNEDRNNNIWFGSAHGVAILSNYQKFYHLNKELSDTVITSLYCDQKGTTWIGTGNGLNIYKSNSQKEFEGHLLIFKIENGLPSNQIVNIDEDSSGNIWILTTNGICKFTNTNPIASEAKYRITTYSINDGLLSNNLSYLDYENSGYNLVIKKEGFRNISFTKNSFFLKTNIGLQLFNPGIDDSAAPNCYISLFEINNKEFNWEEDYNSEIKWKNLSQDLCYKLPTNLTLSSNNNSFVFHFTSTGFNEINSIKYTYKLEGYDEVWNNYTNESKAEYKQLPYGKFIFKVVAKSKNGLLSELVQYPFEIFPPWYKTWWAYSIYLFFGLAGVITIIKIRTRKLEKEKEKLEETIIERTAEVVNQKEIAEQQKHLVEEKQKEILDSIKYAKRIQQAHLPTEKYIDKNIDRLKS